MDSSASVGAVPATPTRRSSPTGATPAAKRPATIESVMAGQRINGQPMEIGPLNDFAYTLYHDMNSMKQWAKFMNEAMDDHAKRLDHVMKDYASNIESTRADLTNTQDEMREALRMINQNDADIKAIVNSVSQELAMELSNMKAGDAQLVNMVRAKLIEIEGKFLGVGGSGGAQATSRATSTSSTTASARSPSVWGTPRPPCSSSSCRSSTSSR